jgi:hypothetical protein
MEKEILTFAQAIEIMDKGGVVCLGKEANVIYKKIFGLYVKRFGWFSVENAVFQGEHFNLPWYEVKSVDVAKGEARV